MGCDEKRFVVSLHDVSPHRALELSVIIRDLKVLVGEKFSVAVIPGAESVDIWGKDSHNLVRSIMSCERMLHGLTHCREHSKGLSSFFCGNVDEFVALEASDIATKIRSGQEIFKRVFGTEACGLIPPAWRFGKLDCPTAKACGLSFLGGFNSLRACDGGTALALATYSWDWGIIGKRGRVGACLGGVAVTCTGGVPVIAIHPDDLARDHFRLALGKIEQLLNRGYQPIYFSELLEL